MASRYLSIIAFLFLVNAASLSQNRPEFFRAFPVEDIDIPHWARLMYSADPDVGEVQQAFDAYVKQHGFVKNIHTQNYKHWIRQVRDQVDESGHIRVPTAAERMERIDRLRAQKQKTSRRSTAWRPLGPFETYRQGTTVPYSLQANVYSIDVYPSDPDILICGTETGTVFYTGDRGMSWRTISDRAEFSGGVTAVKTHPDDPQRFLAGVDRRIYETKDGGGTWEEIHFTDGAVNEFAFDPDDHDRIFCSATSGLFMSPDGGANWDRIFANPGYDVVFHPSDPDLLYALMENPLRARCELLKSTDGGVTWSLKGQGWYDPVNPSNATVNGGKIGLTPADPNRVYACLIGSSKPDDNGWIGLYRSDDAGETWYNPAGQDGGPYNQINTTPWNVAAYSDGYHQGFFNFDLEVSPNNPDLLWVGTIRLSESADGGYNFVSIGAANSLRLDNIHADIQDIEVIGNEIWVASDGGINYSQDELRSSESRKQGINGSDFWGFGSGWNEDLLVGGKYHNGNSAFYQSYDEGVFHHVSGVEESTGYVHPMDSRKAYFNIYWAGGTETVIVPEQLGAPASYQGIFPYIPNESYLQSWSSGFFFDPRYADHMYMGEGSVVWKSVNGGNYFEALHDFGTDRRVLEVKISRADPDVLYTVVGGPGYWDQSEIYRSGDGGRGWTRLSDLGTDMWRVEIDLNPEDENEIWASANSGGNGAKVFRSVDGGQNWENKSTDALNGESFRDIFYQGGSGGVVYLAGQNSVYRYDPENGNWENASDGLPFVPKGFEMRPFYRDGKLRIATYGKGIWETDLDAHSRPIAQPMTHTDRVYCARDSVRFDCHSILMHEGASWEWSFAPEPAYVSDPGARNPLVVFGATGSFDVSLKVTDGDGNVSERTVTNMVEVADYCSMDSIPGLALECREYGDYAQTPDFDREVTEFTVTAWVRPDGIQDEYTGIFMHDGDAAGFNFKNGDNSLAYHWPGGQWWWNSGLIVPPGEWSYVAMTVRPGAVTLYVNGIPSTQDIDVQPLRLGTFKIGSYKGWDGRNYRGLIDEVTVWDRALSTEEIRQFRHLTKEDFRTDPHFLAYYQFNAQVPKVMDRIAGHHSDLSGGAEKSISRGPFGKGSASSREVSEFGFYEFPDEGARLLFGEGDLPMGEVYLSRIGQRPNALPNDERNPGAYWILNNYGENPVFGSLGEIRLVPPYSTPSQAEIDDPLRVRLFTRQANGEAEDWQLLCDAISIDEEAYTFGAECEIGAEGQFIFTSDTTGTTAVEDEFHDEALRMPRVFPNPVRRGDELTIRNRQALEYEWTLTDGKGRIVSRLIVAAHTDRKLPTSKLPAGAYFYRLKSDRYLTSGLILIE